MDEEMVEEVQEEALPEDGEMEAPPDTMEADVDGEGEGDLEFILDIPLDITVELGRTSMRIKDLLQLGQGAVVELTKLAGEPMEIFVNGKLFARGEVVVVNEKFGVRLTDIVSPQERIQNLR